MNKMIKKIILLFLLAGFMLTACGPKLSCSLQAVAGGAQYCEEKSDK